MRILVTNDDGIRAPGLQVLEDIAREIAGNDGEVFTVAPYFEQSGVAHAISYLNPTAIHQFSENRIAIEGTPADCVLAGLTYFLKDKQPDLLLSGVNRGNNVSENTLYSGTVGAAIEATLHHTKAIALSQYIGPENRNPDLIFSAAKAYGCKLIKQLLEHGIWHDDPYGSFYNVNFPPCLAKNVLGVQFTEQGFRPDVNFMSKLQNAPNGKPFLWATGSPQDKPAPKGSDAQANLDGYISITPLSANLTAYSTLKKLNSNLNKFSIND